MIALEVSLEQEFVPMFSWTIAKYSLGKVDLSGSQSNRTDTIVVTKSFLECFSDTSDIGPDICQTSFSL